MPRYRVQTARDGVVQYALAATVLFGMACLVWLAYDLGKVHGVAELAAVRTEIGILKSRIKKQSAESRQLLEKIAILERSSSIDRQAASEIQSELARLEESLQAAREEVAFYRGIVAPGDVTAGLRVHRFRIEQGVVPGEYRYDLVLTQLKVNDSYVEGVVEWKVRGMLDGEVHSAGLAEMTDPAIGQLKFRFRYFQDLSGTLRLPEGFVAQQVQLVITPKGKKAQDPVIHSYDWPEGEA